MTLNKINFLTFLNQKKNKMKEHKKERGKYNQYLYNKNIEMPRKSAQRQL